MMEKSMVSVIVPVYNAETYISKCVESILAQTYKNLEIILVDDGSTDSGPLLCDNFADKDDRIKVIHKKNAGVSSARNSGLDAAKGEYIAFVDSDDWIEPEMYEKLVENMEKNEVDAVFCGYSMVYDMGDNVCKQMSPIETGKVDQINAMKQIFGIAKEKSYNTAPWNKLIKSHCIGKYRFNPQYSVAEDALFLVEVARECNSFFLDSNCYYNYFQRENSAYHTSGLTKQRLDAIRAWVCIIEKVKDNSLLYKRALNIIYHYGINVLIEAYVLNAKKEYEEVKLLIKNSATWWYKDSKVAWRTKVKTMVLHAMVIMHMPRKCVAKIYNLSRKK